MDKTDNTLNKWTQGISYEIAFWNNVYRWKHTFDGMMSWSHYGREICLEGFDANRFLAAREKPVVLDVGCGMSYATGNHVNKHDGLTPLDIHYVDPLADYFNEILRRHNRQLPAIEFGMMEYLSSFYPKHDLDMIIIQNALDHSANPYKGIVEAIDCLTTEGILYLNHHPNEAETEHYKGFHQYNIINEDGHLIIWNRNGRHDVNKLLEGFAETTVTTHENGHVIAVIRKTADVPQEQLAVKQDRQQLAKMLIGMSKSQRSIWQSVKFNMQYTKYNIIQFFAQALTWEMKMSLKRAIKQA